MYFFVFRFAGTLFLSKSSRRLFRLSETVCYPETLSVEVMVCTIINQAKQITDQMSEMFGLRKSV